MAQEATPFKLVERIKIKQFTADQNPETDEPHTIVERESITPCSEGEARGMGFVPLSERDEIQATGTINVGAGDLTPVDASALSFVPKVEEPRDTH